MSNNECRCCCEYIGEDDYVEVCCVCEQEVHRDCSEVLEGRDRACNDCMDNGEADKYLDSL